jgi:Domain of unknown function (DUF4394)
MEHKHSISQPAGRRALLAGLVAAAAAIMPLSTLPARADDDDRARSADSVEFAENLRLIAFGLTADQRLVRFRVATPSLRKEIGTVHGFGRTDSVLVGIDFRVQDGKLYGVGDGGGIYTIDTKTAEAKLVSQLTVALDGKFFGVDFNPAADRLRIISDTGQNLAHNVNAGGTTAVNTVLNYPAPVNINPATGVTGAAYTNNDLSDLTGTTLFDIDATRNQVAIQSPPGQGALVATGSLTVDPDMPVGFDIYSTLRKGMAARNSGFASLVVNGVTGLYRVNLLTGRADFIGPFKDKVVDIALPLNQ